MSDAKWCTFAFIGMWFAVAWVSIALDTWGPVLALMVMLLFTGWSCNSQTKVVGHNE